MTKITEIIFNKNSKIAQEDKEKLNNYVLELEKENERLREDKDYQKTMRHEAESRLNATPFCVAESKRCSLKAENERLKEKINSITESGFWELDEALELLHRLDINCTIDKTPKVEIKERVYLTAQSGKGE